MNFEPEKFFIGLVDFFSILLPGALFTYLLKDDVGPLLFGFGYYNLGEIEGWAVFFFSSYLLGHFIFLLGAALLDDYLYDPIRCATYDGQIGRLAKGKKLPPRLTRRLALWMIKEKSDLAFRHAERIKKRYLDPLGASPAINVFQWCKARLTLDNPVAMATIQHFEADSKFFRSLFIVLCILIPLAVVGKHSEIAAVSAPLLVLAFWRYADQRTKSTSQAYWYIITLEGNKEEASRQPSPTHADGPSHAGGVVFKKKRNKVKYLLVEATRKPKEWVLPKGHIKPGERMQETAVREVHEETGVWARITCELDAISYSVSGELIKVQYYLMEALEEGKPSDQMREHEWKPLEEAVGEAKHVGSKELLKLAEQERKKLEAQKRAIKRPKAPLRS